MGAERAVGCMAFAATVFLSGPALGQNPAPEVVRIIVHTLPLADQQAAQGMKCELISSGARTQQYCSWRMLGRNSFAEIWGAVVTQVGGDRWVLAASPRPAAAKDVVVRGGPDNGQSVTLWNCLRAKRYVDGGKNAFCIDR